MGRPLFHSRGERLFRGLVTSAQGATGGILTTILRLAIDNVLVRGVTAMWRERIPR